jgi:hypothetical protein
MDLSEIISKELTMKEKVKSRVIHTIVHDIYVLHWTQEALDKAMEFGDGKIGFYFDGFGFCQDIYLSSCYGHTIKNYSVQHPQAYEPRKTSRAESPSQQRRAKMPACDACKAMHELCAFGNLRGSSACKKLRQAHYAIA